MPDLPAGDFAAWLIGIGEAGEGEGSTDAVRVHDLFIDNEPSVPEVQVRLTCRRNEEPSQPTAVGCRGPLARWSQRQHDHLVVANAVPA